MGEHIVKPHRSVFIVGNCYKAEIIDMLLSQREGDATYKRAKEFSDADIVLYTGGADVSPYMYGERALPKTYSDSGRDAVDKTVYNKAITDKKFVVGICRGAQITNVLNGGKLWQDVSNHANGQHHPMYDVETGRKIMVSSLHHQECILTKEAVLLGYANTAIRKQSERVTWMRSMNPGAQDVEAFWYPKTFTLGFQPHPEVSPWNSEGRNIFFEYVDRFWKERETTLKVMAGVV